MPRIRDRRAAALAALLAVLGTASTAMGLRTEATALPPVAVDVQQTADSEQTKPDESQQPGPQKEPLKEPQDDPQDDALPAPPPTTAKPGGMARSEPTRLEIPAIKLNAPITAVGLNTDGTLEVPPLKASAPAGWYRHSPTPGEPGAAVIIGHVDSAREGPAVFFRLRELTLGDTISVRRKNGTVATLEVYRVATYPKHKFPTDEVYGPVNRAELRLITCGGSFDRSKGSYRDNVVVYAAPRD
ncbi:sortase (surface protein transpeptidase) [Actinoplanes lutulentus]|uniref:Sortase (Surface protein transpeptidase) n=1 Tax=Actinoplanes lutulentus TaxID=1287878 RepID=A0A327ZCA6_9ACTN|nr:class F sortase [Actinoplanes lutulentus]MBB2946845.1 sortase (surface protein transpeptidase) [Actinoplanes lutulentus]RAK35739.1 sortase (surface protein transpeptidase) [Actinoplanes lutulentus]